jgi:protocatechuate 3,4-dioxygenase beta subunit
MTVSVTNTKGSPIEGAAVEIPLAGRGSLAQAVTDARGSAQFRLPADAEVVQVTALKSGLGFDVFENYQSSPPLGAQSAYPDKVSLTLAGARRVTVKAIDSAGRPAAGIQIRPFRIHKQGKLGDAMLGGSNTALAITDAQGIAQFDWIPRQVLQPIRLTSIPWEYDIVGLPKIDPSEADAEVTVRILRNTHVAGKVFLPAGTPAAGVLVHASGAASSGNMGYVFTRTASDGSYAMLLAPDQIYAIGFLDPRGAASPLAGVIVREGVPREGLDLRMVEGALVRGRVTRDPDGGPAAGEKVNIELTGEEVPVEFRIRPEARYRREMTLWTITDDEGRYTVRLPPGKFTLSAGSPPTRAEVQITAHEEIARDFTVRGETGRARQSISLTGFVVERIGARKQPVAGAEVREVLTRTTGFPLAKTAADARGRFTLPVGMRPQLLYARSPDGTLAGYLEVPPTGEVEVSVSAAATILGRVVDAAGRPVVSRRIDLSLLGGAGAFEHQFLDWQVHTDKTGAFLFSGLVPGSEGRIVVPQSNDFRELRNAEVREFKVPGPEPIVLPKIIIPADRPAK